MSRIREMLGFDPYGNLLTDRTWERLSKVLSPRYLYSKARLTIYERRHQNDPWITQTAIEVFNALLRPHHRGLEWGSGKGSAWIAKRCASLVSVEHNPQWHAKVCSFLQESGVTNVDYRCVQEGEYVSLIKEFPDEHFHFIVVDGLFRDATFLQSIPKLAPDGFILFDNANWYLPSGSKTPHSRSFEDGPCSSGFGRVAEEIKSWKTVWTTNGVNDTAVFIKPISPFRPPQQR